MASFKDFLKKAVKYTNPIYAAGDVVKDRAQSYGKTWGTTAQSSNKVDAVPIYNSVIEVDAPANNTSSNTGGYYTGGGTGSSAPAPDPLDSLRQSVQTKFGTLKSVFDAIYGDVDNLIREKTGKLNEDYDRQLTDMTKSYDRGVGQNSMIYGARGLGDSSYLGDAQGQLKDSFDRSVEDATSTRKSQLADVGRYGAGQRASLDAERANYEGAVANLGSYDQAGLNSLAGNLDSAITGANVKRAGMGTEGDFINKLNAITPAQQQFTNQLATKLQNLITSSAPVYAKKQIAQGLIKGSVLDDQNAQSYWSNYFEGLLNDSAG